MRQEKIIGIFLLILPFYCLLLGGATFAIGLSISEFLFSIAIIASSVTIYKLERSNFLKTLSIALSIVIISILISFLFYDYSYDGQSYHQKSIWYMMHGWNPYFELCPDDHPLYLIWVNHYAKGAEIISSVIAKSFKEIECGKAVNLIMSSSIYFFAYDLLKDLLPDTKKTKRIAISLLISFPAIVESQLFTYYIDWALYVLFTLVIIELVELHQSRTPSVCNLIIISIIIVFAISIKFHFIFWIGLPMLIYSVVLLKRRKYHILCKCIGFAIGGVFIGFLVSYNPYMTNISNGYHLFYPLIGDGAVDIMTSNTPPGLKPYNDIEKVFVSLFSASSNDDILPIYHVDFDRLRACDNRIGGFGSFFSFILLSAVFIFTISFKKHSEYFYVLSSLLTFFLCLFILPSGWWARYVPFFSLFPIIILLYLEHNKRYIFSTFLLVLLFSNNIPSLLASIDTTIAFTSKTKHLIDVLDKATDSEINFYHNEGMRFKIIDNGISYKETNKKEIELYCNPTIYIDKTTYKSLKKTEPILCDGIYNNIKNYLNWVVFRLQQKMKVDI